MEPRIETAHVVAAFDAKAQVDVGSDGTLYVKGVAAEFGLDRDNEAFLPDAFDRGMKAYMESNPILAYHHAKEASADGMPPRYLALGTVTKLYRDAKALHFEAAIPKPTPGSWAEDIYDKVRRRIVKGISVGGAFKRRWTELGPRIFDVDLQEISITPLPVNPRTMLTAVTEGKAMDDSPLEWVAEAPDPALVENLIRLERIAADLDTLRQRLSGPVV